MILSDGSHEMTRRVVESISKVKNDLNVNMYVVLKVQTFEGANLCLARWLSWLERRPVTAEVDGSIPFRVVSFSI